MSPDTTFFFYDLETSGQDPRRHRIMQFAGRRTNLQLEPIGEPVNVLVKLADDVLPDPMATLITGLTPQQTVAEGITEAELVKLLHEQVMTPGTIMTGFNSVRFDDEFLRFTFYRNFYDPYEWAWKDGRSRWDLLDVVRMTRALRPDGIQWAFNDDGDPINTLVSLSTANQLVHAKAHDAMSDVDALVAVARLIQTKQPKLWDYLFNLRTKSAVTNVISPHQPVPFVYSSGRYGKEHNFTTVAAVIGQGRTGTYYVYDLRVDPGTLTGLSIEALRERLFSKRIELEAKQLTRLPVKELAVGKCPAVAPLGTLSAEAAERLNLSHELINRHFAALQSSDLPAKISQIYDRERDFPRGDVDGALYDGFIEDKAACAQVRQATASTIDAVAPAFGDARLEELLVRYKGRNFPAALNDAERTRWDTYRRERIMTDIEPWSNELQDLFVSGTPAEQSLLTDLQLWAESIYPAD